MEETTLQKFVYSFISKKLKKKVEDRNGTVFEKATGKPVTTSWMKMSKVSKVGGRRKTKERKKERKKESKKEKKRIEEQKKIKRKERQ